MNEGKLRVYLDSNAWISVINSGNATEPVIGAHQAGIMRIMVSQENLNELITNSKIKPHARAKNLKVIQPLIPESVEDALFVIDHSRLGYAGIGDEACCVHFQDHMHKKAFTSNNLADGVHLVNALKFGALLISCDDAVQKSSIHQEYPVVCLKVWFSEYNWDFSGLEHCECVPFNSNPKAKFERSE